MQITTEHAAIKAVLGPTNTGKTHYAMERLLAHESGMIGFPLRLLARENYDRAVLIKGKDKVALITGEEKIVPDGARYFLCTVESMPVDREVAFMGIDEIQMCADPDRGHIFTDRLLHARGSHETLFMGAETIKGLLRLLIDDIEFITRPRLSTLTHTGTCKLTRLAPRSAIVGFSAADVYGIAELMRRQRGGAAVVLGALSPRTRNAQVEMYQSGEVDYLIATDAIGMGLNMEVEHVAFSALRKFDGRVQRDLRPAELAQIAGRAGRYMNDGTFGTTADAGEFDPVTIDRIENHSFKPHQIINWRNSDLDFATLEALRASLALPASQEGLVRARQADDERVLAILSEEDAIRERTVGEDAVHRLWEVCRIPDFRNVMSDGHARLLNRIFHHLMDGNGALPTDWLAGHVGRIERTDGDIETLVGRINNVRIWTYIAYQGGWLDDPLHWQERTRAIEDSLSDALHNQLTQRFVDRRTAVLMRRMGEADDMSAAIGSDGSVEVEGHFVGNLKGFRFTADRDEDGSAAKAVSGAALKVLPSEIASRVQRMERDPDAMLSLDPTGTILWRTEPVGKLRRGADALRPQAELLSSDLLDGDATKRLQKRLDTWLAKIIRERLAPLFLALEAKLSGAARGLVFRLSEGLGVMVRDPDDEQIAALSRDDRRAIRKLGIRLGRAFVFFPDLLKPAPVELRVQLWATANAIETLPDIPPAGRVSVPAQDKSAKEFLEITGFRHCGKLAVRIDMLERIAESAWNLAKKGPIAPVPELLSLAGCSVEEMTGIFTALGFRSVTKDGETLFAPGRRRPRRTEKTTKNTAAKEAGKKPSRQRARKKAPRSDSPAQSPSEAIASAKSEERSMGQSNGQSKEQAKEQTRGPSKPRPKSRPKRRSKPQQKNAPKTVVDENSPFAKLRDHVLAR